MVKGCFKCTCLSFYVCMFAPSYELVRCDSNRDVLRWAPVDQRLQEFYPPLDLCPPDCNYKDEPKRVKWRSKQNVDYAFLMSPGGTFLRRMRDGKSNVRSFTFSTNKNVSVHE